MKESGEVLGLRYELEGVDALVVAVRNFIKNLAKMYGGPYEETDLIKYTQPYNNDNKVTF
jgi:hypothetical protein